MPFCHFSPFQVSYEEFKLQFAQMYEHYERHRTDNITDPALRRAHPISTISGWDRDHDQSTDGSSKTDKAITNNTRPNETQKVSKSEQTDDNDVVGLENVKCVCEENVTTTSQDETTLSNSADAAKEPSTQLNQSSESNKPVQSISSISQVYNEQLTGQSTAIVCNGDAEHAFDDDDDDVDTNSGTPAEQATATATTTTTISGGDDGTTSASDALRKTLEIDSYDINEDKEIVDEIVEEILTKSETLLDDCKRSLDDNHQHLDETETTSSPVIKDEEIELAVSEVVKGVRNIERKMKRDSETDAIDVQNMDSDTKMSRDSAENMVDVDDEEANIAQSDESTDGQANQKTELELSNTANDSVTDVSLGDDIEDEPISEKTTPTTIATITGNATEEIKEIVTTIVNDVIENCVNDNDHACVNKMSIIDNINNNSSDLSATNDSNDNAIIVDTITQTADMLSQLNATKPTTETITTDKAADVETTTDIRTEETNEDIITGIVREMVDKCVESETNAANIDNDNNNNSEEDATLNKSGSEATAAPPPTQIDDAANDEHQQQHPNSIGSAKFTSVPTDNSTDNRTSKLNRTQGTSISTSTQVENNHFGNFHTQLALSIYTFAMQFCRILQFYLLSMLMFSIFFSSADQRQNRTKSSSNRPMFSPGPSRPPFRIPEFKWSYIHQRLLSDVLFSLETDIQVRITRAFLRLGHRI